MIEQNVGDHQAGEDLFPWMKVAWSQIGAHERAGSESDPMIAEWAETFGLTDFDEDVEAYCAVYPRYCFHKTLPNEPLPPHPKWSWGWRTFGIECVPQLGCVLTFFRGDLAKQIGHNGFYLTETTDDYIILGANQQDPAGQFTGTVNVKRMPKARMLASRWPKTWPLPG